MSSKSPSTGGAFKSLSTFCTSVRSSDLVFRALFTKTVISETTDSVTFACFMTVFASAVMGSGLASPKTEATEARAASS